MEDMLGGLSALFPVEPLTPEQEARLPIANALVDKIVPAGTLGEAMGSLVDGILTPFLGIEASNPSFVLEEMLEIEDLDIAPEQAIAALAILDPVWEQRQQREVEMMPVVLNRMFTSLEPTMKSVMGELYAINFDDEELAAIGGFFETPEGASYARKSFTMSADPRVMGAVMQALPELMGVFAQVEADFAAASADLPAALAFADLTAAQKQALTDLTGLDDTAIENAMAGSGL